MIKIHRFASPERAEKIECSTAIEALAAFEPEQQIIIVRCSSDEEYLGLTHAVLKRTMTAIEMGVGDTVWVWGPSLTLCDGDGWRMTFEQNQAFTKAGMAKQQVAQRQQAQQALSMLSGFKQHGGRGR